MRQSKRTVIDRNELIDIMKQCDVCRLAFNDGAFPYIIPINFGIDVGSENISLYFHGAIVGKKYDLMRKDNRVSFEMDCSHKLITAEKACGYTMEFESVVGHGVIEILGDEDKLKGLSVLMSQYSDREDFTYDDAIVSRTNVMKLNVMNMTGKRWKKQ